VRDEGYCAKLREKAASYRMFIEANVGPPRGADELDQFEAELRTAKACGTGIARTVIMPGRRYEQFSSLDEFKQFAQRGQRALELAEPVAAKHRVRLAVENHKDQRLDERVALFKHLDSEWIGACVDVGNSIALLEDPVDTAKAFAPWAVCVHLKDQAVREYEDGFLLADIPLGEGFIDLKQVVAVLRAAKPGIAFSLEMITRDPLKVPCLTQKYWATMPDVPGADLAAMLRAVRARPAKELAAISNLPVERQAAVELEGVRASLRYARGALGI
jgi:sugar phosphate isomerase/epimerase